MKSYPIGMLGLLLAFLPAGLRAQVLTNVWTGAGADALASTAANWLLGVPQVSHHILLDGTSHKNLTWDAAAADTVAGWTQVGYGGTVTVATVYGGTGFTHFTISGDCLISNGVWNHPANATVEAFRLQVQIEGNLTIGPLGAIIVTDCGYSLGQGPGGSSLSGVSSGMHGGRGGGTHNYSGISKRTYGSVTRPVNLGSGGGSGRGGGAIRITVGQQSHIDGIITAKASMNGHYRGAGGSVWLTTGTLTGAGDINADGADISANNAPGGGGRVAIWLTDALADFPGFSGAITAYGGERILDAVPRRAAGPGTVYRQLATDSPDQGELIVDNRGNRTWSDWFYETCATLSDLEGSSNAFRRVELRNGGLLSVGTNTILDLAGTLLAGDGTGGIALEGGTLLVPAVFTMTNLNLYLRNVSVPRAPNTSTGIGYPPVDSSFNPATALIIGTNTGFYVDWPHALACDVTVEPGGLISHTPNLWNYRPSYFQKFEPEENLNRLQLTIDGDLTISTGAAVNVSARGYPGPEGPGRDATLTTVGGSHGGRGGALSSQPAPGPCYGSLTAPQSLGSGGNSAGLVGGGAAILTVSGTLTHHGLMAADGTAGAHYTAAGGSINLTAGALAGNGAIQANGGDATGNCPGGGGRIAVAVTNAGADFAAYGGVIRALSGRRPDALAAHQAAPGTIYLRTAGQGPSQGMLWVANDGRANTTFTEISSLVTDTTVGQVHIRDAGHLLLNTNQSLTVSGVWSNAANFTGYADSAVIFEGGPGTTSTLYGATLFGGITATNAGHVLCFEAGSTFGVAAQCRLRLRGDPDNPLVLRSTSDGAAWRFNVSPLAEQGIEFVDAADSDASPGTTVIAMNSVDGGGNTNWSFVTVAAGETNAWTGADSTVWSASGNWSRHRMPTPNDVVVIPAGQPRYPVFDLDRSLNRIEIEAGASLHLNGFNLTVTNGARIAGAFAAAHAEQITFLGDADFSGGAVTPVFSTLVLAGQSAQTVDPGDLSFYRIRVLNAAGPVHFSGGLTVERELRCEASTGVYHLVFQEGRDFRIRDLILQGSGLTTNIVLHSSTPGQAWRLRVTGLRSVSGVDVQDSDAGGGLPITAVDSANRGGNLNWLFGLTPAYWLGTTPDFHTPGNWSPAIVPDAATRIMVATSNPMTLTGAVTVLDFTIGGGADTASVTVNASLTVAGNLTVLNRGLLAINRPTVVSNQVMVMAGGWLTHSANSTTAAGEVNKLDLSILGALDVDEGGRIDVMGRGYQSRHGPGAASTSGGGSYGGRGDPMGASTYYGPCYGSIIAPTNIGSGGGSTAGGGAILLKVAGQARIDGLLASDGQPAYTSTGSGGSISLVSGTLRGAGAIQAMGGAGTDAGQAQGSGAGGRIALIVTNAGADFAAFTGTIQALGGPGGYMGMGGGGGTIYQRSPAGPTAGGVVRISQERPTHLLRWTDVPPSFYFRSSETRDVVFQADNRTILRLTNDFTVGDIWLNSPNTVLDLNFKTLYVKSFQHNLGPGTVINYGAIIWIKGSVLTIR